MSTPRQIAEIVREFNVAREYFIGEMHRAFPPGCVAQHGINQVLVIEIDECSVDHMLVEFENGNRWSKPVVDLVRIVDRGRMLPWVLNRKRKLAAQKGRMTRMKHMLERK